MPHIDGIPTGLLQEFEAMDDAKRLLADDPEKGAGLITLDEATKYFWRFFHANGNLLDNWYFVGGGSQQGGGQLPINQVGEIERNGYGYFFDRWILGGEGNPYAKLDDNGVVIGNVENKVALRQRKRSLVSGKYTLSALGENTLYSATIDWNNKDTKTVNVLDISLMLSINGGFPAFAILLPTAGMEKKFIAAKLELGDHQTLAHKEGNTWVLNDPPPNYALELAKCQRYQFYISQNSLCSGFKISNNEYRAQVPLPVTMRGNPTLVGDCRYQGIRISGEMISQTLTDASVTLSGNIAQLSFKTSENVGTAPGNTPCIGYVNGGAIIDCNL